MDLRRTPDERFENLPGYPFTPHYTLVDDLEGGELRLHYVDEGPSDAAPVVLFHGEPTWSYLYRKMIPGLVAAGHRVLAPDLAGFGRSDKPARQQDYSVARHVAWMRAWAEAVDVQGATFFGQDWGSLIGLTVVAQLEQRFARVAVGNAALPDPAHPERMAEAQAASVDREAFSRWQAFAAAAEKLDVGEMLAHGLPGLDVGRPLSLSSGERAAYDAPFPDASYQAGALVFPSLIGIERLGADGITLFHDAWRVFERWDKPFVTAYGKADPVLGWFDSVFQRYVPGAKGQPHREFPDAGHFVQEYEPDQLVEVIDRLIRG
jgi:haloalkane dehalogenase